MARSVSTPAGAVQVAYADWAHLEETKEFTDAVDDLRELAQSNYPSLRACNRWVSREDRAILENGFGYITVSEYNGIVAVSVVPKAAGLAEAWCRRINLEDLVACFGDVLISKGRFSNGEQVFICKTPLVRETISSNGCRW